MDSLNKILSLCLIVLCSCTYEKKNNSDYTQVENDLLIKKQDSLRIDSISKDTILIKYNGSTITHYKNFKITKEITKDSNSNTWFETIYKSQDDRVSIFYFPDGTIRDKYVTRNGREFIDYSVNQEFLREARINGYSINDTIVIFDRIREDISVFRKQHFPMIKIANIALNQTLIRTINTSLTTLIVIGSLLLFGGTTIKAFCLVLLIGIVAGTYSSIFIASPVLVFLHPKAEK